MIHVAHFIAILCYAAAAALAAAPFARPVRAPVNGVLAVVVLVLVRHRRTRGGEPRTVSVSVLPIAIHAAEVTVVVVGGGRVADARSAGKLVNRADLAAGGNFSTMAVHRAGDLTVGVVAGVPAAASRVRDVIAQRFDTPWR